MLQTMRHLAQSWLVKGLMLFLVISFSIWGIGDIFRGNPLQRSVAKVGKVSISVQALNHEFEQTLSRARQMLGPDLTAQQAKQLGMLDQALGNLIERAAVEQDIRRLGIDAGDKPVIDEIAAQPQFRDKDGKFDKDMFRQLLQQSGMSERGFIDSERKELAQQQLARALQNGGKVPQTIIDAVYRARGQKRILDVVAVKDDAFTVAAPDDKALQDFYQQNAQKFALPEFRAITVARLATDDVAKDIAVGDDEVKKAYDDKDADLTQPERRDIVQVVLQDEGKAKQLAASARASGNLAAAAKAGGHDAVPLNGVDEKTILPELAKPVFGLGAGQVSDPVKTSLGWHVVQVKKIIPGGKPAFKDVENQLREELKHDRAIESVTREVNQLDDDLAAGKSLEDIADGMKLRLVKIPAVDAEGKTPDGKEPAELPDREDVLKAAFGQNSGDTSPILDDKNGNYVVVRTDNVTPAAVPPFDQVKDKVTADWKTAEQAKKAAAAAEDIAKSLRSGKPASSVADQAGVEVRVSKPITLLGDSDPGLPQKAIPEVFKMKKGDVITQEGKGQQFVLRLAEVADVDPAANQADVQKVAGELESRLPNERAAEYLKYLRVIFPVDIDESVLANLRQQGG